jgi:hypothetical protein
MLALNGSCGETRRLRYTNTCASAVRGSTPDQL